MKNDTDQQGFIPLALITVGLLLLLAVTTYYYSQINKINSPPPIENNKTKEPSNSPMPKINILPKLNKGLTFSDSTCGPDTIIWTYGNREIETSQAEKVCYVSIEGKNLTQFPIELYSLPNLKHLLLHGNTNELEVPGDIDKMRAIEELRLDHNKITSIPNSIGNLKNLKRLDLSDNQLSDLPNTIGNLSNLQTLILNNNELAALPIQIKNLTNLHELYLENNKLTGLPEEIGLV